MARSWIFVGALAMAMPAPAVGQTDEAQASMLPSEWLGPKITVEEAERENPGIPNDPRVSRYPDIAKPFGFLSGKWASLKAKMRPGDELRIFSGRINGGIALVRHGKVIAYLETYVI